MAKRFQDKAALITGGSSGIGRETALAFASEGANVVVCDVAETGGNETVALVEEIGVKALFIKVDVTKADEVKAMVSQAAENFSAIDFAINNAGALNPEATTADCSETDWQRLIDINLTGVFLCMKYEIQQMLKQGGGAIVNTASIAGLVGFPGNAAYVASKHGVVGLTKTAALEYARAGIRINCVCPGYTQTPMADQAVNLKPDLKDKLQNRVPLGRLGRPEEIARAITYLCSEDAGFVVGHSLVLDGGITAV